MAAFGANVLSLESQVRDFAGRRFQLLGRKHAVHVRASADGGDDFEARLATIRRKGGSGTGKKAELRKKNSGDTSGSSKDDRDEEDLSLPEIPVEEPTAEGLVVALGFNPYSERLHGKLALVGLVALISVELASGTGLLKYHDTNTIVSQIYIILAASAIFIKFQKEKKSVWPQ